MKIKYVFNGIVLIILFALFLWQTIVATLKYLERTTISSISFEDDGLILFPSITVCKKYSNGLSENVIKNRSMNIEDKIDLLHKNSWTKNEVFYFASHQNMFNVSFPCTTIPGPDSDPGKPCSFPFLQWQKLNKGCNKGGNCPTRYYITHLDIHTFRHSDQGVICHL